MKIVAQQSISSSGTDGGSKTDLMTNKVNKPNDNQLYINLSSEPVNQSPFSHQVTSMNESKAKQVCKKRPVDVIRFALKRWVTEGSRKIQNISN